MPPDTGISLFLEKAIAASIPHESLVAILTARGWSEKEVYEALADYFQRSTGIEIPSRSAVISASAKDAFFYLLIFATLATWTIGFGSLAFLLIERWIVDPLFRGYPRVYDTDSMAWSIAALIVSFPLFLFFSRTVAAEAARQPEKLESPVRKWLTYIALVIAACVFMGDLIAVLTHLLRGELTLRFILKACVVLALSGGVFFHYFSGLRRSDTPQVSRRRGRRMTILSSGAVACILIFGFWQLGSPGSQREIRADAERVQQIYQTSMQVALFWKAHKQLPEQIATLPAASLEDPVTHAPYEYHLQQGSKYELCASFARASDPRDLDETEKQWRHPAGRHCFLLDAMTATQYPPQYPIH